LVPPKADPEKIINKGKASQESFFVAAISASGQLPDSILNTRVVISSNPSFPSAEVSKNIVKKLYPFVESIVPTL
jgi:hypothetical protein